MKVVSVINYKGGVGKSTLAANLGAYAASVGRRVLMIDMDPQTHLTFSFLTPDEWRDKYAENMTFKNYFEAIIKGDFVLPSLRRYLIPLSQQEALKLGDKKFDLISSHLGLVDIDTELASMIVVSNDSIKASSTLKTFSYLRNGLEELQDEYDIGIIDCPPTFGVSVKNALFASDYYIIPAKLDYLSTLGIEHLEENVNKLKQTCDEYIDVLNNGNYERMKLSVLGIVPMMVTIVKGDEAVTAQREYLKVIDQKHYHIFQYVRNNSSVFGGAPKDGVPAVLTKPRFSLAAKRIVKELQELGEEFLRKVEG